MVSDQGLTIKRDTAECSAAASCHPMNRWGVVWLLSDKARFATGTVLSIDGGFVAH